MNNWLNRTQLMIGKDAIERLNCARVAVLGLGGVGGAAAEAVVRSGVGHILLFDHDTISITNLNRQLLATTATIGASKCAAGRERLLSINPECHITIEEAFYSAENSTPLLDFQPDFVIDAIDTVTAKLDLAVVCHEKGIPSVCCLGTGNRLDPSKFRIGDITETAGCGCGLARVMRRELKKRGVFNQPVLYSTEPPLKTVCSDSEPGRHAPGSISFCPPTAGYLLAGYAIRTLLRLKES